MKHIMIDLETLGTAPGSAILTIGAIVFDPHAGLVGPTWYGKISPASAQAFGAVDLNTLKWWEKQSEEARAEVFSGTDELPDVLAGFSKWLDLRSGIDERRIWSNGGDFDTVLLRVMYGACDLKAPWSYKGVRCYRTLRSLFPAIEAPRSNGIAHHALHDAMYQAKHLLEIARVHKGGWA